MALDDRRDELVSAPEHGADHALRGTIVADAAARRLESAGQRRLTHEPISPDVVEQLRFGDDPIPMADQIHEHVEDLRLHVLHDATPAKLEPSGIDRTVTELEDDGPPT